MTRANLPGGWLTVPLLLLGGVSLDGAQTGAPDAAAALGCGA